MCTLQQAYDLFIFDRETRCELSTINNYKQMVKIFLDYLVQNRGLSADKIDIASISKDDVKSYMLYLRKRPIYETHPFNAKCEGNLTKCSVHTYMVAVKAFLNYLYNDEYLENDIMKKFKMIKPEQKLIVPLTNDEASEIDSLFNLRTETGSRNLCIFHLMLDAGLRSSEMLHLKIENVDFKNDSLFVSQGKGSKDRYLPLSPKLKKMLYIYFTMYRPLVEHDFFLCNREGEQLTADCVKSLFSRVKKKVGMKRLYPHLLRHTFATSYILGGGDLETLRIFMGHTDISTTQKYLHLATQNRFNSNIYKLDKKFFRRYSE